MAVAGCAGSTVGSGVGDRVVDRPPFYAGVRPGVVPTAYLPIAYEQDAMVDASFEPTAERGTPLGTLIAAMNAYLQTAIVGGLLVGDAPRGTPPDVRFHCETEGGTECVHLDGHASGGRPRMRLSVGRASGEWVAGLASRMDGAGVHQMLVITIEIGEYWPRQKNILGSKEILMGTGYTLPVPWLTALDAPVSVVQLTGAVVGRDGRAVRIGAEGMLANRTNLLAGGFGFQRIITDEDIDALRGARRDDLPGKPIVWQVALSNLVAGLTGQPQITNH